MGDQGPRSKTVVKERMKSKNTNNNKGQVFS